MSVPICEHIKDDGVRCKSPAMHRRAFCYFHWRLHEHKLPVTEEGYEVPVIDSEASVVLAGTQIMRAVLSGKLDPRRAQVAMSCLRLAAQSFRLQLNVSDRMVTELTPALADRFADLEKAQQEHFQKCAAIKESAGIEESAGIRKRGADIPVGEKIATPISATPIGSPLTEQQLTYCRFVLRYGPTHPEFNDCTRHLDAHITTRATAWPPTQLS